MKDLSLIALDNRWRQHELNIPREPCGVKPLIKKRPETFSPATVCAKSMPEKKKKKEGKKTMLGCSDGPFRNNRWILTTYTSCVLF